MPEIAILLDGQELRRISFGHEPITIGRASENGVAIEDMSISRHHARIDCDGERFFLSDLGSANGTTVNGQAATRTRLFHGDIVAVGRHHLLFLAPEAQPEAAADEPETGAAGGATMLLPPEAATADSAFVTLRPPRRGGVVYPLASPVTTLGRAPECTVRVLDWFVEFEQARIERDGPVFTLYALGTPGRVLLNSAPVAQAPLQPGDTIEMGLTRLIFARDEADALAARTRRLPDYSPVPAIAPRQEEAAPAAQPEFPPAEPPVAAQAEASPFAPEIEPAFAPEEPAAAHTGAVPGEFAEVRAPATAEEPEPALDEKDRKAVAMWERALQNPSPMVRKQAAEQLRRLTGRNYE